MNDWRVYTPGYENQILFDHYFPFGVAQGNSLVHYKTLTDHDGENRFIQSFYASLQESPDRLIYFLAIQSPCGTIEPVTDKISEHAVFLGINLKTETITYQDPYGFGIDELDPSNQKPMSGISVREILNKLCPGFKIEEPRYRQQHDKCSCSPITFNNMLEYARTGQIPEIVNVAKIRAEHQNIFDNHENRKVQKTSLIIENGIREAIAKSSEINSEIESRIQPVTSFLKDAVLKEIKEGGNYVTVFYPGPTRSGVDFMTAVADFILNKWDPDKIQEQIDMLYKQHLTIKIDLGALKV